VVRPYERSGLQLLSTFNELICLLVSYFLLPLQNKAHDPEEHYQIGYLTVYTLYFSAVVNLIMISVLGIKGAIRQCRHDYAYREGVFKLCKRKPKK